MVYSQMPKKGVGDVKHPYVVSEEEIRGGAPIIEGTGIKVMDIAIRYNVLGQSTDEIIAAYPHLSFSQVHDALSYYYEHKEEMDRSWKQSLLRIQEMRKDHHSILESRLGKVKDLYRWKRGHKGF